MTIKPNRIRSKDSTPQTSPLALLESLSETRLAVLFLARQAKESKNTALAKELTAQGHALRNEIERLRRTLTAEWNAETKTLVARAGTAQAQLAKLLQNAEKSAKNMDTVVRALGVVSNILSLAGKVI